MENENKTEVKRTKGNEFFRFIKYLLFAISAGVIEFVSFTLLSLIPALNSEIDKSVYWIPALISLILSVIWNFTLNREFTFKSANNVPKAMAQTIAYYIVFAPLSIWFAQMYLIDQLGWNQYAVKAVVMVVNFATEFLYQRFYVFRDSIDTKVKKKKKDKQDGNESE